MTQKRHYRITLEEALILSKKNTTTGHHESLDYIPGRVLLGLVASHYNSFGERAFETFHSGSVRFIDALPETPSGCAMPTPMTLQRPKGDSSTTLRNLAAPTNGDGNVQYESISAAYLGRLAGGAFFTHDVSRARVVKTAIEDDGSSRAKESALFSYETIEQGQRFIATIEADDASADLLDEIEQILTGHHRLGRSRSAQFGRVSIERISDDPRETWTSAAPQTTSRTCVLLLADLSLIDEDSGLPRFEPSAEDFGLSKRWCYAPSRSMVRVRTLDRFNGYRRAFDLQRQVLRRGSVLVFETTDDESVTPRIMSVGADRQEGLGRVLVSPDWSSSTTLEVSSIVDARDPGMGFSPDTGLLAWLDRRSDDLTPEMWVHIVSARDELLRRCKVRRQTPSKTQWGRLRGWAKHRNASEIHMTAFLDLVGGTAKVLSRGWECEMVRGREDTMGAFLVDFGNRHGGRALSELAHQVRAGLDRVHASEETI
jgi:hypothetical protein